VRSEIRSTQLRKTHRCTWTTGGKSKYLVVASLLALLGSFPLMPVAHANGSPYTGPKPQLGPLGDTHIHQTGPNSYYCDPGWVYDNVRDAGSEIYIVAPSLAGPYPPDRPNGGPAYRSYNGSNSPASAPLAQLSRVRCRWQ
jgi:hypothetical protein